MNVGFFGIQYSFGLQQTAVNPLFSFLHARPEELPLLNLAGPVTGLLIQPLIGALSDKTWSPKWGRRKPYFYLVQSGAAFAFFFSLQQRTLDGSRFTLVAGCFQQYSNGALSRIHRRQITGRTAGAWFPHPKFLHRLWHYACKYFIIRFPEDHHRRVYCRRWAKAASLIGYTALFVGAVCSIGSVLWSVSKPRKYRQQQKNWKK